MDQGQTGAGFVKESQVPPWAAAPASLALSAPLSSVQIALPPRVLRKAPRPGTPERAQWLRAGAWLHNFPREKTLPDWTWFGTLTFKNAVHERQAFAALRSWADELASEAKGHVLVGYGFESQQRGAGHFHFLASFGDDATRLPASLAERGWRQGHSRIVLFDSSLGGAWYVTKGLRYGLRWGCSRPARCRRPGRRRGRCIYAALGFDPPAT